MKTVEELTKNDKLLEEVKKDFSKYKYEIGGKKVSEYRFFKTIADEINKKEKKVSFYWTDEKVLLLLKCLDVEIEKETLSEFKRHYT